MNKRNKNKDIYSKFTLKSSENIQNLKRSDQLRVKRGNADTLAQATAKGEYNYWLNQDDLNEIVRLEYNTYAGIVGSNAKFAVLTSLSELTNNLEGFLLKTKEFAEARLTLIMQLESLHWVTLVISYKDRHYIAYYTDSKNDPMPPEYYRLLFEQFKIQPMSLSPGFLQQTEDYNCGLWALENAANLNRMLDENQSLYWLINQLQLSRSKEYFDARRQFLAEKLRADPVWLDRHPLFLQAFNPQQNLLPSTSFRCISSMPLNSGDSKRLKVISKDEKEKVTILLEIFVETFMSAFTKNLGRYHLLAKGESLTEDALKTELKIGITGALLGVGISQSLVGSIPSLVASLRMISSKYYVSLDKAQKITKIFSEIKAGSLGALLASTAVEIFFSFESQFMQITDKAGDRMALEKLAEDAVGRVFNYINKSCTKDSIISQELLLQSIIQGPSEKFFDPNIKTARLRITGNVIQDKRGNSINTANLYKKVGLVILGTHGQPNKYYASKEQPGSHRYGYRRLLNYEKEANGKLKESLEKQFTEEQFPKEENMFQFASRGYNYILDTETNAAEAQRILDKIEHRYPPQVFNEEHPNKISILFDLRKPISNFSGRLELLKTLHHTLVSERTVAIVPILSTLAISANPSSSSSSQTASGSSFSISGLGGVGKTQLALRYAELYAKDYDYNVLWISAETQENLAYSFDKLANKLQLPILDRYGQKKSLEDIVDAAYEYFSDRKSLFIFDNIENYSAIVAYLPKAMLGNRPTLLITSRYSNWENVASLLSLDVFTEQETEELIKKSLDLNDNAENEKIKELNQLLQGLPLAMQQALAYIKLRKTTDAEFSLDSYITLYKKKCQDLLSFDFWNYNNDPYLKSVYTTWIITLEKIKSYSLGPDAIHILSIMAYLDPDNISIAIFNGLKEIHPNFNTYDLDAIVHLLKSYSMLNQGPQQSKYTIHRLLQQVIRLNLEQDRSKFEELIEQTKKLLQLSGYTDNKEIAFHYLHFLLYMSEHTGLTSFFLYEHHQKIFFDNLSQQRIEYYTYFIDLAYLKFPTERFLQFIGNAVAYYIKLGLTFFLAETLDYLEKKFQTGSLSKENLKYAIEYVQGLKDPKFTMKRLSTSPWKQKIQRESIKTLYDFQIKIFGDLVTGYDNCPAHSLKRSICLSETEQDKIKESKDLKIKSHLKKVASLTRTISSGLMAKDTLAALLQGDFNEVAINFGLITSSILFGKISNGLLSQGKNLAAEASLLEKDLGLESKNALGILFNKEVLSVGKRQFLGKTMQAASPFVARATSIFFAYNLKNEIQAYEMGNKAVMPDIISNGIIVSIDGIEAGIEGVELFGIIAGVAEFTGPIGEGITLLAWLGSEMYSSEQQVETINKYVSLSRTEQVVQFLRAFFHMSPSEYLQLKAKNAQLVAQAILFLKEHTDINRYIFPSFHSATVLYKNSRVFLDEKRQLVPDGNSSPDEPNEGHLFCLSGTPFSYFKTPISNCSFSYLCQHALGIEYSLNRTANVTLVVLGSGNQEVVAAVDSPTVFIVENGKKLYKGGDEVNVFDLQGNFTTGLLQGGQGWNILILDKFNPEKSDYLLLDGHGFLCGKNSSLLNYIPLFCSPDKSRIQLNKINQIRGRNNQQEIFYLNKNMREIDGGGGRNNEYPDTFFLSDRSYKSPKFILRNNTIILFILNSSVNSVDYLIPLNEVGVAQVQLHSQESIQHRFFSQTAIQDIQTLSVKNNTIVISLNILGIEDTKIFTLTISDSSTASINNQTKNALDLAKNISYFFQDIEMKLLNNEQVYLQEKVSNNKTIDENISLFAALADRLEKSFSLQLFNNSMISIGRTKYEIFHINGLFESHLVGNGGENVYIILPCKDPVFPLAPITLYDTLKEDFNELTEFRDTLDLRELVKKYQQIYPDAIIFPRLFRVGEDLFLTLINAIYSPSHYLKNLDCFHSLVTIQLKNAVLDNYTWYEKIDIFIDNLIPKNIRILQEEEEENEIWNLVETPLVFTDDKQIIVITDKDIGEQAEIIILKNIGYFIFLHTETDLILSNIPSVSSDVCTIILADFKIPEMKKKILLATFKFFDREFRLQDYQDKIEHATYFSDRVSTEDITMTPSFLDLISTEKITSEHKESLQQKELQRRKRQTVRENNLGINSKKTIPKNENKLSNLTFFPQNKPYSQLSRAFDEDRILKTAEDYAKKYQDSSSKKNTTLRVKKSVNQKNNEGQASPLISANKRNSEKKQTIYTKDKHNYHKQSIQKKSNFNLKKQTSPMSFAQHGLKSSVKSRTENLAVNKNKFLKNTFLQDKKISLATSAASNFLNHKEGFKNTIKAQPRLSYQQSESKSQHKPNQYTTRLSRIDALTNFNATLLLIQLMGKIRTPISHHSNPKLNKILKKNQKQEDKIKSEFFAAQFNR